MTKEIVKFVNFVNYLIETSFSFAVIIETIYLIELSRILKPHISITPFHFFLSKSIFHYEKIITFLIDIAGGIYVC